MEKNSEIPQMSVGNVVETLSDAYLNIITNKVDFKLMPTVMLWGPPGVGKSQAVREIAEVLEKKTLKKVVVTDVRLLLFNPIDLRGIPTSDKNKEFSVWLKPKIFDMVDGDDVINILFLDEISAAPPSVQAASYQIALDRVIGEHSLPKNCFVITAGNREQDKSVVFKMPKALANRLLHIDVLSNFKSWKEWAIEKKLDYRVIKYLDFARGNLCIFDGSKDDLAFPTPRTWEMVSNILKYSVYDIDKAYPLICGLVGSYVAIEFKTWVKNNLNMPNIEDIFKGFDAIVPKGTDELYGLVKAMCDYAKEHHRVEELENSIKYAKRLPKDYAMLLIKNYLANDKINKAIKNSTVLLDFLGTKAVMNNGI